MARIAGVSDCAYAVAADDVALVFDSSGPEECVPGLNAALGPGGYVDGGIVVVLVAAPHRKTQVVAYL